MSAARSTYRSLLRTLKKCSPSSSEGGAISTKHFLRAQHNQSLPSLSTALLQKTYPKATASNYLNLLKDLQERARLHALDQGAERKLTPKEMTRRSAARSGFVLPDMYDPEKDGVKKP